MSITGHVFVPLISSIFTVPHPVVTPSSSNTLTVSLDSTRPVRAQAVSDPNLPKITLHTQLNSPKLSGTPSPIDTPAHLTQMPQRLTIPSLPPSIVFLYLVSPYLKLGALYIANGTASLRSGLVALVLATSLLFLPCRRSRVSWCRCILIPLWRHMPVATIIATDAIQGHALPQA